MMRVSVFCSSSTKVHPAYFDAACRLGKVLAQNGIAVNYGGGQVGLMGMLADTITDLGGSIRGIIPEFMVRQGWNHQGLDEMVVVSDMHERMIKINEDADAFIALPGGIGTLSELLETITMKQLGQILQPIVIINTRQYFNPLLEMLESMVKQKFMREIHREIWSVVSEPEKVLDAIRNAPSWDQSRIKYAPA